MHKKPLDIYTYIKHLANLKVQAVIFRFGGAGLTLGLPCISFSSECLLSGE